IFLHNAPPPPEIYALSLHDALPICGRCFKSAASSGLWHGRTRTPSAPALGYRLTPLRGWATARNALGYFLSPLRGETIHSHVGRSEEHTSELQSRFDLVCRLLLEKK